MTPTRRGGLAQQAVVFPAPPGGLGGFVSAQPSKNYNTRYLLAAALAAGRSRVRNAATSEDSQALVRCLHALGARVDFAGEDGMLSAHVSGVDGSPRLENNAPLNVGNAGAVLRFLLGVAALLPEVTFVTDRPDSLGRRPNADMLDALAQMGCEADSRDGCLPITLRGGGLRGGTVRVSGARSSQYLSGLLFLAPLVGERVTIEVLDHLVSKSPVRQTIEVLAAAGVRVDASDDLMRIHVAPQSYCGGEFTVNGDWPGSAAVLAAAAVAGGDVTVRGLADDRQGERAAADVLRQMGADVEFTSSGDVRLRRTGELRAVEFDGDKATDAVLALVGAACFARGRSRFHNVANLRIKECDRISEPIAELRRLGVACWEGREIGDPDPDAIVVDGRPEGYDGGVAVDGRKDHRVIMLLSEVALGCRKPVTITGAEHVAKSYPAFFDHMTALGADIRLDDQVE